MISKIDNVHFLTFFKIFLALEVCTFVKRQLYFIRVLAMPALESVYIGGLFAIAKN
jgi:hypothetical protein